MAHDISLFQKAFGNPVWLNKYINSMRVLGERAYFGENYHQLSRPAGIILSWNLDIMQPIFLPLSYPKHYASGL